MTYSVVKSLHIIGFTCWFAGLFLLVRYFIYHVESQTKGLSMSVEVAKAFHHQFCLMERRLWRGILLPSMWATIGFGAWLLFLTRVYHEPWFILKFGFFAGLFVYTFFCGSIRKKMEQKIFSESSKKLRLFNEVATVFLVVMVFTAVTKEPSMALFSLLGVFVFGFAVLLIMRLFFSSKNR